MNPSAALLERLRFALAAQRVEDAPGSLHRLVEAGLDGLPGPGSGATLQRWQALAAVAEHDLSLAKLYEGHTDALALLAELHADSGFPRNATWAVWAAEAPQGRTTIEAASDAGRVFLHGAKCWCSGAADLSHALLTAWDADGRAPQLVSVALDQPGVEISRDAWKAVGMAGSASLDVTFHGATATLIGAPGAYLARPGFWHGGAGVAACWYGGARGLARALRDSVLHLPAAARTPFRLAALGKVDLALRSTATLLNEAAGWIDRHPFDDASALALRVRLSAEASARDVLDEVGRALGATPFCRDQRFARAAADLPVFIRQSHAERDFAALGERLLDDSANPWSL